MLTLITGTPGAGKSLYAVWEIARKVPGSTIENGQSPVQRKLYSNIKNLLVEHQHIDADDLNRWHEWAQPGDVILFDEVQEVWRPRGIGSKIPECIAKLEVHRHMGVDIIMVTQHPMLLDQNIRRLVNQHIHMRRVTRGTAMRYEWDHCENPGNTRTCVDHGMWFHPKKAYALYKSAQLHTKPTVRIPKVLWVGVAALAGLAYLGPTAYARVTGVFKPPAPAAAAAPAAGPSKVSSVGADGQAVTVETVSSEGPPEGYKSAVRESASVLVDAPKLAGCIAVRDKCGCFDADGQKVEVAAEVCTTRTGAGLGAPVELAPVAQPVAPMSAADLDSIRFAFSK